MKLANLRSEQRDGIVVAQLEGEVDMSNAEQLKSALVRGMTNESFGLVLDLSALEYIDSAGIHILLELREQLKNRGQALRLVVPAGSLVGGTGRDCRNSDRGNRQSTPGRARSRAVGQLRLSLPACRSRPTSSRTAPTSKWTARSSASSSSSM
jgi:anti-anti-sigma factor